MDMSDKLPKTSIKVNGRRMKDLITEEVTNWIMSGALDAGQRIREDELATVFGVSRIPAREALHELAGRGLVEIEPFIGAFVKELSDQDVQEVYLLRSLLEPAVAKAVAFTITPERLEKLEVIQEQLEEICSQPRCLENSKEIYAKNREFHMGIYESSNMDRTLKIINNLWDNIAFIRIRAAYSEKYSEQSRSEHRLYLKLLREHKGEELATELKKNLESHARDINPSN